MPDKRRVSKPTARYRPPREPNFLREQLAEKARGLPGGRRGPGKAAEGRDNLPLSLPPEDAHSQESNGSALVSPAENRPDEGDIHEHLQFVSGSELLDPGDARSGVHTQEVAHRETGPSLALEQFPTPSNPLDGTMLPRGPDLARKQQIVKAIESPRRRQKVGPAESQKLFSNTDSQANLLVRGRLLLKRFKWEESIGVDDTDLDPRSFVDWLTVMQLFWDRSSWRHYRLAAQAVIQTLPNDGRDEAIAALIGSGRIETSARRLYKQSRAKNVNLSADRAELIRADDYHELLARLRKMSGSRTVIEPLEDWLVAGLHTGVLPAEWPLADLEKGLDDHGRWRVWLHVVNASATGVHRTLDISGYTEPTLKAIERMVKRSEQWALKGTTARHRSEVARVLDQACAQFFPSQSIRFSLFTVRHQFLANMKAVLQDDAVVSALIGRIVVRTERAHHTKVRAAWSVDDVREVPTPLERQVSRFRKLLAMYEDRLNVPR